jgi:hypothetical protein
MTEMRRNLGVIQRASLRYAVPDDYLMIEGEGLKLLRKELLPKEFQHLSDPVVPTVSVVRLRSSWRSPLCIGVTPRLLRRFPT